MSQGHMPQLLGRPCDQGFGIRPWILVVWEFVVLLCHSSTPVPEVACSDINRCWRSGFLWAEKGWDLHSPSPKL